MLTYESSASIDAPAESVWCVLADVSQWPQWLPTVSRVQPLGEQRLGLGSRFIVHQPGLRPTAWTVTVMDAPRRFVWMARSPGVRMVADHRVTVESSVKSGVILRFSFEGVMGGIVGRLFGGVIRRYLAQEAAALKERVESSR